MKELGLKKKEECEGRRTVKMREESEGIRTRKKRGKREECEGRRIVGVQLVTSSAGGGVKGSSLEICEVLSQDTKTYTNTRIVKKKNIEPYVHNTLRSVPVGMMRDKTGTNNSHGEHF